MKVLEALKGVPEPVSFSSSFLFIFDIELSDSVKTMPFWFGGVM